jgi:hypothetical protein
VAEYTDPQIALLAAVEYSKSRSAAGRSIQGVTRDANNFLDWLKGNG